MMMPATVKTFDEYAQQVFIPYMSSPLRSVSGVDLVWDTYKDPSERHSKSQARKGVRRRVVGKAAVPGHWQNLLPADSNNTKLFSFLSKVLLQAFCKEDKDLIDGKGAQHTAIAGYPHPGPMQP